MAMVRRVTRLRRLSGRLLNRLGYDIERLDDEAWLVQRHGSRLRAQEIGPARLRTHVVTDEKTLRRHMFGYQKHLGHHLGEEHLAWICEELGVDCVLDVGANTGQFATRLR